MKKIFTITAAILAAMALNASVTKVKVGQDLQAAIDAASAGDTILVQSGTFTGNFTMKEGVQLIGGWTSAMFLTQEDYGTILDANKSGRVLTQPANFTTLTVVENFTIQNGYLDTDANQSAAGVWLCNNGRVQHCLIQDNKVSTAATVNMMGGGVFSNSSNADPDTIIYDCIIRRNSATHGGGVRVNGKGVVVYNSVIEDNETVNNAGGGVHLHNGSKLINSVVRNNKANGDAGGVRITGGNVSDIINCLIVGNTATSQVGGISDEGNLPNIINCTIVGNKQQKSGATASLSGVKVNKDKTNEAFFVNNIVWGNMTGDTIAAQAVYYISKYDKTAGRRSYNAIQGQYGDDDKTGTTSWMLTNENPGFVDAANGDYRLAPSCALHNLGNNEKVQGTYDLAGNARIQQNKVDLGCYETLYFTPYVKAGDDLQAALDAATAGDTIYLQKGTYVGNYIMRNGVNVSGGWNETFTAQDSVSVLDGDAKGRVLTQEDDFTQETVYDNLVIQNGNVDGDGGGVYMLWKSKLKNCLICNNVCTGEGGGVKQDKDDNAGDIILDSCVIENNTARAGGGLWMRSTALHCTIRGNHTTTGAGGGVVLSWARLYNSFIIDNVSGEDCGGVRMYGGGCQLINCLVARNYAEGNGDYVGKVGGIALERDLSIMVNCTVVGNDQKKDNTDQEYCGIRFDAGSGASGKYFMNNVIYGNKAGGVVQGQQISYNCCKYDADKRGNNAIEGNVPGDYLNDNVTYINLKDVQLSNIFDDTYKPTATSVLLDKGKDYEFPSCITTDLSGKARKIGDAIDLGCFEVVAAEPTSLINTEVASKSVKMMVNGQLVILKDGVMYNVMGAQL